ANRHAHKKFRSQALTRMASTGESYQQAVSRITKRRSAASCSSTDLVPVQYFGLPLVLATLELGGRPFAMLIPSSRLWDAGYLREFPLTALRMLMRPRGGIQ
ncbi:MAG: hypothetical protein WBY94_26515, partial [Polyangiaceae bacterium]